MRSDALLAFVALGAPLSLVGSAGVAIASPNVIDLLGLGVGVAPSPSIIGNAATFGTDMGIGKYRPELAVNLGTTPVTANSATLNIAFQGAQDLGAGGNYQPGTWKTFAETGAMSVADMTTQIGLGYPVARFPWLPAFPANFQPRFLRLLFSPASATNFSAGTIASALVTIVRDDTANKFMSSNYVAPRT